MKLIKPSFSIIEQQPGLEGVYKQIELGARLCYKSEDKITEDSYKRFIERLNTKGHLSPYEHGTVYLKISANIDEAGNFLDEISTWTKCKLVEKKDGNWWAITTNYRVLIEHFAEEYIEYLLENYQCEPTEYHEKRVTVKFVCDRGVSHEFVRHRVFSFCQESQRYCAYNKDKFNNEVTFCIPCWLDLEEGSYKYEGSLVGKDTGDEVTVIYSPTEDKAYNTKASCEGFFLQSLSDSEIQYFNLLDKGWKPQQAREVLSNATKTELMMTGFVSDWKKFFELRCQEAAHPSARELAIPLKEEFIKRGWLKE